MGQRTSTPTTQQTSLAVTVRQPIPYRPPLYWRLSERNPVSIDDFTAYNVTSSLELSLRNGTILVSLKPYYDIRSYKEGSTLYITPMRSDRASRVSVSIQYDKTITCIEIEQTPLY